MQLYKSLIDQEVVQANSTEHNVNEVLQKKHDPMVCHPAKDNEFIWKARLVSQLNGNLFLSKDRLQQVKGERNQYYSAEELQRMRDDKSVTTLSCGHDIVILFEGERANNGPTASAIVGRQGDCVVGVQQKNSTTTFIEI